MSSNSDIKILPQEKQFYIDAQNFIAKICSEMNENNIKLKKNWYIDHLCFRCESDAIYTEVCKEVLKFADLLIESPVNGRMISSFKLHKAITYKDHHVDILEVPAPKKNKHCKTGFEHFEIVVDSSFAQIQKDFPHANFDVSGLNKDFNHELELHLSSGNIKFHQLSLESVIRFELSKAYHACKNSKALEILKEFDPKIVGTFPLNLDNELSDIDILIHSRGQNAFILQKLDSEFSSFKDFQISEYEVHGVPSIVCQFEYQNIAFEIFAQDCETHAQTAFKHFQIEERLLKLANKEFFQELKYYRSLGLKTEPAFGKCLNIEGDAYLELLKLHNYSKQELYQFLQKTKYR